MAKFTCNFISYTLKRAVDITVVIPSVTVPESLGFGKPIPEGATIKDLMEAKPDCSHTKKDKYPVLYLFHGMGNNHATWTGYTGIEMYAEERNIAVVNISAENKAYVNHIDVTDRFYDFIEDELSDFVSGMFPVSTRPEDTYIAGLSMGGFGTLVHVLNNPEKYKAFGTFSAGIHSAFVEGKPEYDPITLANQCIANHTSLPSGYMCCGGSDTYLKENRDFYCMLKDAGYDVTWDQIEPYGHEWRFWNIEVEKFLDWMEPLRTDAYAGSRRKI